MNFRTMQFVLLAGLCTPLSHPRPGVAADLASPRIPAVKDLPAECRRAKANFQPLGPKDVAEAKRTLASAVDRLDGRLTQAGPVGDRWRKFLELSLLKQPTSSAAKPDLAVLRRILSHFNADGEGLELVWFLDVKEAIDNYLVVLATVAHPNQRREFERKMDILAAVLKPYVAKPTAEDAVVMGQGLRWLYRTKQAQPLAHAIEAHLVRPNLFIEISAELIGASINAPFADTHPVRDCILGTDIHGTSHTVGRTTTELSPHPTLGVFDTIFRGTTTTDNVGYHWPVTVYSTGTASLVARKRIWFDVNGLHSHPTVSKATTGIDIHDIEAGGIGRRIVERIAWRRACNQLGEAQCITSDHTEQWLEKRMDQFAITPLQRANQAYLDKFRRPLVEQRLFPQKLRLYTTQKAISIIALQTRGGKMAAPAAPPPAIPGADLSLRIHESMINNLTSDILAGRTLHEEKLQTTIISEIGYLPEKMKSDKDGKPWAITFARRQPVTLAFADGGFTITLHGTHFREGRQVYPHPLDISATYEIVKSDNAFKAIRQGEIRVFPPGQPANANVDGWPQIVRELFEQQIVRALLQNRFMKVFVPEFSAKEFELLEEWKAAGRLQPIQANARNGWLVIAWKRSALKTKQLPAFNTNAPISKNTSATTPLRARLENGQRQRKSSHSDRNCLGQER